MAISLQRRKQNSKGFELVFHEERLRNVERAQREEAVQLTVLHAHERFGNARLAGALGMQDAGLSAPGWTTAPGLNVDAAPLAGDATFLQDQLSLALVGFDTGLLGPDASNSAVNSALSDSVALGDAAMRTLASRDGEATDFDASHPAVLNMHSRGGSPLPTAVAARLGAAFGHDFSHVRVHTDAAAAAASEALNARAFAIGAEIWFGQGAYAPGTPSGDAILAHELTHVVQSDEGRLPSAGGDGLNVSSPTDSAEREAYANERAITARMDASLLDVAPMTAESESSGVATQPVAGHQAAPTVDGQALDGAVMRTLDWKRKHRRPGVLDVGIDPPGKTGSSLLSGDGLKFDARIGDQNAGVGIKGNLGGEGGNNVSVDGQFSYGKNSLGVQANVGEDGVDVAADANPAMEGVIGDAKLGVAGLTGSANVDAGPLKVDAALGAGGVTATAKVDAAGLKVDAAIGKDGESVGKDAKPGEEGADKDGDGKKDEEGKEGEGKDGEGTDGEGKDGAETKKEGAAGPGATGKDGAPGGGGGGGGGLGGGESVPGMAAGLLGAGPGGAGPALAARTLGELKLPAFNLKKKEEAGITKETGMTPAQHQQQIEAHVDRIKTQVDQMREGLKRYAADKALGLDAEINATKEALRGDIAGARGRISGAYGAARAGLTTAGAEALGTIQAAGRTAREALATSLPAQQARLTALVTAGRTNVDALGAPWKEKFGAELEVGAKAFDATGKLCATELAATKAAIVNTWPDTGNALERAENEARRKAAGKGVDDAVNDFKAGGAQKAAAARAQKPSYDAQIEAALTTLRQALTTMETNGRAQLVAANERAGTQITTQSTEAETAITTAKTRAEGALTTAETAALGEVDTVQAQQDQNLTGACDSAKASIASADGSLQERYAQWFDGVLAGIPKDQATTYDQVKEFLAGKERDLPTFNSQIMGELDKSCETARQTVMDAANNARTALTRLTDGQSESAANQGRQQADGLRATAVQFAVGINATGTAIETAFTQHIEPMGALVTQRLTLAEAQLTAALAAAKTALATQNTQYATQLRERIARMPQTLTPMANAAAAGVYANLSDRAQRVHTACKGIGTDENAVYNALRGLTAISGAALEQVVWGRLFRAEGGLMAFLVDDLNEDELKIARAYLGGNTALGARLELDASMHWYGDDEAQIEKILRDLSPEDLAAMKADPAWATTRARLVDNLGGTDLDVTKALIAGNVARADAYRLREKIDEARRSNDPDALADALAGVDPAQLAAVQQEFVNIQNKVDPEATNVPPIDATAAANQLADYATRDVQGIDPNTGEVRTNSVTGANRDLVRALATQGKDSVQAATSRFEVERQRSGGPNMERMEKALMSPAALQEDLHSPDPAVRDRATAAQNQRETAMREMYAQQYGGNTGRTMDSAIGGMFSGRDDKESQTSQRLMRNMLADGTNSPRVAADMIALGADGAGTNEAMIKRALGGMRPDEVAQMNTVYQQVHGESVFERLGVAERDANGNKIPGRDHASNQWFNELSGDDRREVEMLLQGDSKYMSAQQQMALARSQYDWQRGSESGAMGRSTMDGSAEQKDLDRNFNALTTLNTRMRADGTFANPEDQKEYQRLCGDVGINATQYQAATDRTANYITTGVAIVGAVVVTAATFGSGAPAGAAMIMAAAGTAASGAISMGVNAGMKGGRYGYEQAATDAGITAVNTLTAGAGAYMKGAQIGVGALGKVGSQVAIDGGMGFVNGAAQTAMTDGTWDKGFWSGMGDVGIGGARQSVTDMASSAVSNRIDETALGKSIDQGGGIWRSAAFKGASNAAGGVASVAAGTAFDAARGKGPTDLSSFAEQAGTEGAKQFVMGAGGGALGSGIRQRRGQAAPTTTPPPGPGGDPGGPPPGSSAGPAHDPNTPPPPGGGGPDLNPAAPRTADTSQRPVGSQPDGTTNRPPSAPSQDPNVDASTGRQPAGTQVDAATVAKQQQAHGGQGGRNDNDAHVVRDNNTGESTVTSPKGVTKADDTGVATRNRDGTTDFVDAHGNRTTTTPDGTTRTLLADGTAIVRDPDGTAVAVKGDVAVRLDAQGKVVASDPAQTPVRSAEAVREQAVFDRVDALLTSGKLTPEAAWAIVAKSGDASGQEVALRAAESRISRDDAVINRLVDIAKQTGPDGTPTFHPSELDAVIAAPDPLKALQVLEARAANKANDTAVKQSIDAATKADAAGGNYVDDVFDNITVGAGFAGISNELSALGNGAQGKRLVVGGENPWLKANADLGQRAGESDVAGGAQPMRSTADSESAAFMQARQHAENVEVNRAGAGVGVLSAKIDGVELRSQMEPGTTWHKDAAARIRINDGVNADGSPKFRYVYANHIDLAGGAGPSRGLTTEAGPGGKPAQIDADLYAQMKADGRIQQSDQGFDGNSVKPGEKVLVLGAGAAGAWGAEGSAKNAASVEWLGRMARPDDDMPAPQKARLEGLHDRLTAARAAGDDVAIQRAMGDLERFTFTEGRGNGFLPRNQREGAAFDPAMQSAAGGKITRSVTDDIKSVTFETNPATGKQQIRMVGNDGQEFWADRVVLAIGQDGEGAGGPGKLLGEIKGMTPLIDASGKEFPFPVVVGVESADGAVRVIGAAATSPAVRKRIASGFRYMTDENFGMQAGHGSVPTDSRGVVGSFHHSERMIRGANRETLIKLAQADAATQQRIIGAHDQAQDVKAAADNERLRVRPVLPGETSTPSPTTRTGGAPDTSLIPGAPKLVGPEAGQAVTTPKPGETPLIGLSGDFYDPKATGEQLRTQLTEQGVPRQQQLSQSERTEETRFADWAQKNAGAAADGARKLAEAIGNPDQPVFEVDAMKRLLPEYGAGGKPASPEEKAYRLEMNHALHPTAVAIARLGFQERLDVLARLPDGDPAKQVFVTSGGCAAGKGDLTGIVKDALGDRAKFGAVWDAAGEGDAGENAWVLRAAQERGIKVVFGYAEADPTTRFQSVLERAEGSGRVVDVMTFINSYSDGAAAFKSFMDSPEYKKAVADGQAEAFGIAPGEFNRASLTDKSQKAYPDVKPLNGAGEAFGAQHVGDPPNKQQALEASLRILEEHVRTQRAAGKNPDAVARGALENAIKFLDGQPPEVRVAVLESYARIFGGAPK